MCYFLLLGIICIAYGKYSLKNPDFEWDISWRRQLFVAVGEPTEEYCEIKKRNAKSCIGIGIAMIVVSMFIIFSKIETFVKSGGLETFLNSGGYDVVIDGKKIEIPCDYSDIEKMGYEVDSFQSEYVVEFSELDGNSVYTYVARNKEGDEFEVLLANTNEKNDGRIDWTVVGIGADSEKAPEIDFYNGVTNKMNKSEVDSIMNSEESDSVSVSSENQGSDDESETYTIDTKSKSYILSIEYDGDKNRDDTMYITSISIREK